MRAAPYLETSVISAWNSDPDSLLDHPLMAPPTEEELLRLAEYLEANTPESFVPEEIMEEAPEPVEVIEEIPIEVLEEEIIITETVQEEIVEEAPEPIVSKGPRKPQLVKRRKAKHAKVMSARETKLAGLAAVKGDREIGELPSAEPLPKTAIGVGKEGAMPSIPNTIPTGLNDAARQDSAKKSRNLPETKLGPKAIGRKKAETQGKVVSPLAARGIEIKRNVAKRSQASSVPQKEIDIDKELESWKFSEEEKE